MARPLRRVRPPQLKLALLGVLLWCLAIPLLVGVPVTVRAATTAPTAPEAEAGLPFIRNFSPTEYGGAPQNWSIIQDRRGVIYLGNVSDGLFAFDGARWRRIPIPNRSAVRSLAMDANGRIYVGAVGDFGYLEPDAAGQMHFVSLLDELPAEQRQFTDVWKTIAAKDGVYFNTRAYLFRFANGAVKAWKSQTAFHMAFLVNETLYVREFDRGLMKLTEAGPELVAGGERFAEEKIYVLLPWIGANARPGELLIGTRSDGWWLFDGANYRRWSKAADAATHDTTLYSGIWLSNGQLALAAPPTGVLILDQSGNVVHRLGRANGLANNAVNALFQDSQRGLWVTSDTGLSRISLDRPITAFDERNGLIGAVLSLSRHAGKLYAGTTDGLFQLDESDPADAHFKRVAGVRGATWALLDSGHGLLVGTTQSLYAIQQDRVDVVRSTDPFPVSMLRSRRDPERIFLGSQSGLNSMRWDGQSWRDEGSIGDFHDEIRSMVEDAEGHLWLGTWNSNVLRIVLPAVDATPAAAASIDVRRFSADQGIPLGSLAVIEVDGELRVGSATGILAFDPSTSRFVPDPRFADMFDKHARQMTVVQQDREGTLWIYAEDIEHGLRQAGNARPDANGNWKWDPSPLQPLAALNILWILPEPDGVVWFSAEQGLFRYAPKRHDGSVNAFSTLLGAVSTKDGALLSRSNDESTTKIPYQKNAMRFEFAAPSYDTVDANRFQTQLNGVDHDWSSWSREAYRDYTNIPDGDYRFQVRAHNVYGDVGQTASFDFRVLSPWYRAWWAWALWAVLAVCSLAMIVFWRSTALRRRNRTLVDLVDQRTEELQDAIRALSEQNVTDPLTGLKNRRYLHDHIQQDVAAANRQHREPSLDAERSARNTDMAFLMVDIDHFKEVNDTYGHAAGDRVLQQMRDILLASARDSDTPIRWGGEEFVILARFTKPKSGALLAERLRAMVAAHPFDLGDGLIIHRTCSIGFASYPFFADQPLALNWEQVINIADECMYAAKRRGRNGWVGAQAGEHFTDDISTALRESLERAPDVGSVNILLPSTARA